jgi:SAM-dependent methyltransferase
VPLGRAIGWYASVVRCRRYACPCAGVRLGDGSARGRSGVGECVFDALGPTVVTVEQLPPALDGAFDAILAVNCLGFWTAPAERPEDLRRRLTPGGRIAIASQPRCPGATRNTSLDAARSITDLLQVVGFERTRTKTLELGPPVVCVLPVNQEPGHGRLDS